MSDHLDGNVLAGPLAGLFSVELTTATARCAGCGTSAVLASAAVYGAPMGLIARCPGCGDAWLRYADTGRGGTLDMRGIASLRFGAGQH
jgi:hypothetical protein